MATFLTLTLAHLLADFPLQTDRIFRLKISGNPGLAIHVLIHVMMAALLLRQPGRHAGLLVLYGLAHFVIDWLKVRFPVVPQWPGFVLDQLAHMAAIVALSAWQPAATAVLPLWTTVPLNLLVLLPALLMLFWVWSNDARQQSRFQHSAAVRWASEHLLIISQRTGWVALGLVFACRLMVL